MVVSGFGKMIHWKTVPERYCMMGVEGDSVSAARNTVKEKTETERVTDKMEHTRRGFERYQRGDRVQRGVSRRS